MYLFLALSFNYKNLFPVDTAFAELI